MNARTVAKCVLPVVSVLIALAISELLLREFLGLGNPVLYDNSPIYGFRPLPGRSYTRFWGAQLAFNNLGLRADRDWDDSPVNKVLFLGDSVTYGGSFIANQDLFSAVSVRIVNKDTGASYIAGNGGVNAWGVENIHALVLETGFQPSSVYVSTLLEGDFYRGLTRLQGLPFFNVKPRLAMLELWYYFCSQQNDERYEVWTSMARPEQVKYVVDKATRELNELDLALKARGHKSVIFISPNLDQLLGRNSKDQLVKQALDTNAVGVVWMLDELGKYHLSDSEKRALYVDNWHLSKAGHKLWGKVIAAQLERTIMSAQSRPGPAIDP